MKTINRYLLTFSLILLFASLGAELAHACDDSGRFYKHCANQEELYAAALNEALAHNRVLAVVVGYEACPWCKSLGRIFDRWQTNSERDFQYLEIATDVYDREKQDFDKVPSGRTVRDSLISRLIEPAEVKGYPAIFVVNPETLKSTLIDTGDLEKNDEANNIYGHDEGKVRAALVRAARAVGCESRLNDK